MSQGSAVRSEYVKLENQLVLLSWLNALFGYGSNKEVLKDTRNVQEGFGGEGQSYMLHHILGRGDKVALSRDALARYDANIKTHLDDINRHRAEPITLRYFQHLAVVYTEVYLDWYFNHPKRLLAELNSHVEQRNADKGPGEPEDAAFEEEDLRKLAYWMATGSGKTLIMHFNYRQFLHCKQEPLDNILLITPNEGLSEQHIEEMALSGIPCERFNLEEPLWVFVGSRVNVVYRENKQKRSDVLTVVSFLHRFLSDREWAVNAVNDLIEEGERIYEAETSDLPNIHFDRHLYQPLLVERDDRIISKPEGLKESEEEFVEKLRAYCVAEAESALAHKEVFLLRNLTRGKGVGFFENEGFFPDFILWVKEGQHQRIVFVEPRGMRHEKAYWSSDKLKLHERLQEFSEKLHERGQLEDIELDSHIISATHYDELRSFYGEEEWSREAFGDKHILFAEDGYVGALFEPSLSADGKVAGHLEPR